MLEVYGYTLIIMTDRNIRMYGDYMDNRDIRMHDDYMDVWWLKWIIEI